MTTRRYPIGIQTFERIRKESLFYVDKTELVYRMTHQSGTYFFLSRPRRFGKSLLVSTLQSYFEGRKELFEGLAIDKLEKDWTEYPVLHFSMATAKHMDVAALKSELNLKLLSYEKIYGKGEGEKNENQRLMGIITRAYQQTGKQVVVLIDEYDAPLLDVMHEDEMLPKLRNIMRNFYSPLKDCEPMLRFVFLTGITKFSQLSIFSELNNIKNISMNEEYAAICGITKDELLENMQEDIAELAKAQDITYDETVAQLTRQYDGYHFTLPSPDIFNPFSLLNCFSDRNLGAYWFGSGTPTYLIEMMRKFEVLPSDVGETMETSLSAFDAPTEHMIDITPLLYQSGYVTIKDYDRETQLYTLAIPNGEIRTGLFESLLPNYLGRVNTKGGVAIAKMSLKIRRGDMDGALQLLQNFLYTVPYCDNTLYEGHYQQMLYVIFTLLTPFRIDVEQHTQRGRTDMVIETLDSIYIMELKFDHTAAEALAQIERSQYARAYAMKGKPVTMVGIGFNVKEERNITEWVIKE